MCGCVGVCARACVRARARTGVCFYCVRQCTVCVRALVYMNVRARASARVFVIDNEAGRELASAFSPILVELTTLWSKI